MKVLVLGAGGTVGAAAVAALVERGHRDIVAADLDGDRARAVGGRHGVRPLALDLTDDAALRAALDAADLVLSAAGPFYRFGVRVLRAAIDTGTAYVDVADDPAPTLAMLDLDGPARAAGVTAVVGAGASPGLSNLLAVLAARELDRVDRVVTAWPEDPVEDLATLGAAPSAATVHWVHQLARPVPALRDGAIRDVAPLAPVALALPGDGATTPHLVAHLVGHPEAVTLHRALPGLRESINAMLLRPGDAAVLREVAAAVGAGLTDDEGAALLRRRFAASAADRGDPPPVNTLLALAEGERAGRPASALATLLAHPPGGMGPVTAIPAAIAAELVVERPRPGVHPPEVGLDPDQVLRRLVAHVPGVDSVDELVGVRTGARS